MSSTGINSTLKVSAAVGDRDVLDSGVVHVEGNHSITFSVANLKFVFCFKKDDGATRYSGSMKDNALYVDLFNHKNPLGEGLLTPMEIARIGGRALSITYYVSTVDANTDARRFEYAIYLGGAE